MKRANPVKMICPYKKRCHQYFNALILKGAANTTIDSWVP
jgi:hypothetical protein